MLRLPTFTYHRPTSVADAVRIAADHGPESMFVAGGTDLYPNMKRRHQTPREVISLSQIAALNETHGDPGTGMSLGAMVSLTEIERSQPMLASALQPVAAAAALISTPLLRNMGTIGGNLLLDTRCNYYDQSYEWRESINFCMKCDGETCWVAPSSSRCWAVQSSDSAPLLAAMGAEVSLVGPEGERRIPVADLYHDDGIRYLNKDPGELLTGVHLPAVGSWRASYRKLRRRGTYDFPVLGVGACIDREGDTVTKASIFVGGTASHPVRATAAEEMLVGQKATDELIEAAAQTVFKPTRAMDNTDHEAVWRKKMAPIFARRAIADCLDPAS